ncbi:P-loop containing nucleoside triphosphate hydrolase protein [Lineolata rhizophorae]|uniref:P-loop containing nucleoside triphosphate hydrolase protein n=1 Tax=Lineolata rhizophorae TaxID=578093 RepID=A0A6A6NRP4_9PEZI|nr:P-loop containing nucleoside triphosphate hydrolase protein [Lineolata rhizophorae]
MSSSISPARTARRSVLQRHHHCRYHHAPPTTLARRRAAAPAAARAAAPAAASPQARASYLCLYSLRRALFSASPPRGLDAGDDDGGGVGGASGGQYRRSDFTTQGYTGIYEPGAPTAGPLGGASNVGAPRLTPRALKEHLDAFVVGQERAKKVLSVAVYNHYQRILELERQEDEKRERAAQRARAEMGHRHPVEDEFPGQQPTVTVYPAGYEPPPQPPPSPSPKLGNAPLTDTTALSIDKSNVLLLGPSGVGKTLMAKTLARVLEVPFSMTDCTPLTQAGYIGEDADVCVQRLLAAANYDVAKAERGIVCLDEIDKIATAKVAHGKDVGGEGVQQALLKIIEGTTLQIQAKQERGAAGGSGGGGGGGGGGPGARSGGAGGGAPGGASGPGGYPGSANGGGMGGMGMGGGVPPGGGQQRPETFNVRTDNILFICTGAFNGLHKLILDRVSKGSIGFGAPVRSARPVSAGEGVHETLLEESEAEALRRYLPYYEPTDQERRERSSGAGSGAEGSATAGPYAAAPSSSSGQQRPSSARPAPASPPPTSRQTPFNTLDLVQPSDLQTYGLIPELVGRLPVTCALSALPPDLLVRVLTEPRHSLLQQYAHLLALSGVELRVTTPALHALAAEAAAMGTGARGLRTVLERVLADAMFEAPGSGVKVVLVDARAARRERGAVFLGRGERGRLRGLVEGEEEEWERGREGAGPGGGGGDGGGGTGGDGGPIRSFEEYRQRWSAAGFG